MAKTCDPRCFELATVFLANEPELNTEAARVTLACEIQQAIEEELTFMRQMMKARAR